MINESFWKNKKVLITGHTGFKGSWLCKILLNFGADVAGYSLEPPTETNLFDILKIDNQINSIYGDIRDHSLLEKTIIQTQPEIIFHLAAQPIVRESYENPLYTYETNVMGTVNILECIRKNDCVKSFLNVTTDKVYRNNEWEWGYREDEPLNGFDPYSNSKSCSELVTNSYNHSFFFNRNVGISTARAGNVIGGGDFAKDRIIPDCVRAIMNKTEITIRNPYSVRPYQHVLEPLFAYLLIAEKQYENKKYAGYYNVGPDERDCISTEKLVGIFCDKWGNNLNWVSKFDGGPHESNFLKLDCSKIKKILYWNPVWNISEAVAKTIDWTKEYFNSGNITSVMDNQIYEYIKSEKNNYV